MKMYSTVILFYRAEPSTGKQRSVVSDSPDQPTGPEQQAGRAGQAGQSGTAGQSGEPVGLGSRAGTPQRRSIWWRFWRMAGRRRRAK